MKSLRKTNYRIQQRNQHLKNILEEKYYIELGTIDISILEELLAGNIVNLEKVIYPEIAVDGIGKLLDNNSHELKYQLTFLESLRYKNTSNKIFLTSGVLHYRLANETHYSYAPIVLIPIEIDYSTGDIIISGSPIVNNILIKEIQASLGIIIDPLPTNANLYDIYQYCTKYANATKFEYSVGNYLTVLSIEYTENQLDFDDLSTQRSIYEKSAIEVHQEFFNKIKAVTPTNIYQKWVLNKIANGESFVVDGKIGTGKTYTIINAICDAIAKNKKVLYVSQDFDNINYVMKELNSLQASSYVYSLSKNTLFDNMERENIPQIREEKVGIETLYPITEYEQALEASINGCRYFKIITRLAEIKNTIPDIIRIPIDVSLKHNEIQNVYQQLKEIETILEDIEPLEINVWSNVEQYYSKNNVKEIAQSTKRYADAIRQFNKEIRDYCKKYQIKLPENFIAAQRLLSYISTFTKMAPPKCWVNKYDSEKINELLNTISSYQNANRDIKEIMKTRLSANYQVGDIADIVKTICHTHLTIDNKKEIVNLISENDKIKEITSITKVTQDKINGVINHFKKLLNTDNITSCELNYFEKLNKLLQKTVIQSSWITFYSKNKNIMEYVSNELKENIRLYNECCQFLAPYVIKEESLKYENVREILSDRNYLKIISTLFDKKIMKKNKVTMEDIDHRFITILEIGQKIELEAKKYDLLNKLTIDDFSLDYFQWLDFLTSLNVDEERILKTQLAHNTKDLLEKHTLITTYNHFNEFKNILEEQYAYIEKYGIYIKGNNIIEKNHDSKEWLDYLRKIIHLNDMLYRLYKDTVPTYEDLILIINNDKAYMNLVESLEVNAVEMREYLGNTYKSLETDCMYISILEKNFGLFIKTLKDPSVIKILFTDNTLEKLIEEFRNLDILSEKRLVEHNLFSRYFVGGQYNLLECSLDQTSKIISKYEERVKELEPVFQIFDYLRSFEKLGLKQLVEGILGSEYSKGISEIYIYSTYLNYKNELINKYPILLENSNIPIWLENFNYFERNYCKTNIRFLERNKNSLDKRLINHVRNICFNDYNKIVDTLLPHRNVILADVDILNSDLDLSKFDIVFVDDIHLSSGFKYHKVFHSKQVVMFGDSSTTYASSTNIFKQIPKKYIFRYVESYVKDNSKYGNIPDHNNQYILDFNKTESIGRFKTLDEMVNDIVKKFYQDFTKKIDIIIYSINYKVDLFKALVIRLKELYNDNDVLELLNNNIRIVRAPKENPRVADEVYFLIDDLKEVDIKLLGHIVNTYSIGCQKVFAYTTAEYSKDIETINLFKDSIIKDIDESKEIPQLTKIIYNELKERGVKVENGIGKIDLVIKGQYSKGKQVVPNIGIIIEGLNTKTPYSLLEDYQYYLNVYQNNGWNIYIFYVDDIIDNLQDKLDSISEYLSNKNTKSMHQLKIDEFIR